VHYSTRPSGPARKGAYYNVQWVDSPGPPMEGRVRAYGPTTLQRYDPAGPAPCRPYDAEKGTKARSFRPSYPRTLVPSLLRTLWRTLRLRLRLRLRLYFPCQRGDKVAHIPFRTRLCRPLKMPCSFEISFQLLLELTHII